MDEEPWGGSSGSNGERGAAGSVIILLRLLVATTNPGKLREIRLALEGAGVELVTLDDFSRRLALGSRLSGTQEPRAQSPEPIPAPEETGATFAENALLKARYYAAVTGLPTVAEDSGLAIDALGGRPGVESARYHGATYPEKFANLYRALAPHPRPWRARFVCSLALVRPPAGASQVLFTAEGVIEGEIAPEPRGSNGFGYDPLLFYPPYGRTLGEVSDAEKLVVSHRGQAFRQLRRYLVDADARHLAL